MLTLQSCPQVRSELTLHSHHWLHANFNCLFGQVEKLTEYTLLRFTFIYIQNDKHCVKPWLHILWFLQAKPVQCQLTLIHLYSLVVLKAADHQYWNNIWLKLCCFGIWWRLSILEGVVIKSQMCGYEWHQHILVNTWVTFLDENLVFGGQ